jgi:DNA-binding transcriptional LysR family regulator
MASPDLNELFVFATVVKAGTFTGAARALGMPKSTVSRKVSELEEWFHVCLLQRTTRRLRLTDVGQAYFEHAARVVAEVEEAERAVSQLQEGPRGRLKLTTPLHFPAMSPVVASFLVRYPDVQVDMVCTDRVVNLVDEGFDVAIRAGSVSGASLIVRQIGHIKSVLVATPRFLKEHGTPKVPADLAAMDCVLFAPVAPRSTWTLQRAGRGTTTVIVKARLAVNDPALVYESVLASLGVASVEAFRCADDVDAGRLKIVLPAWAPPAASIHAVAPSARNLSPKVRAFLDHLREHPPVFS